MQSKRKVYVMIAGLAIGLMSALPSPAMAGDKAYFAVLERNATMSTKADTVSRTIDMTVSYPVVVERAGTLSPILQGMSVMPVILERTTTVKPHHLPFSFGVWP